MKKILFLLVVGVVLGGFAEVGIAGKKEEKKIGFSPSKAPKPDACFRSFIKKVKKIKKGSSLPKLFPYFASHKVKELKMENDRFNPKLAAKRKKEYKKKGKSEDTIAWLTDHPYEKELKRWKELAKLLNSVGKYKINGNKATLIVTYKKEATIKSKKYKYCQARVKLVGEKSYWRIESYSDTNLYFNK